MFFMVAKCENWHWVAAGRPGALSGTGFEPFLSAAPFVKLQWKVLVGLLKFYTRSSSFVGFV
jgi:hypothetical protein